MIWFALAAVLFSGALFLAALALLAWVAYRFLSVVIAQDSAILREIQSRPQILSAPGSQATTESLLGSQLKQFIADRMKPTDGEFIANTDEEMFIQEQVKNLRDSGHGGISEAEMEQFVRQAVSEKV